MILSPLDEIPRIVKNKLDSCNIKHELDFSQSYLKFTTELTGDHVFYAIDYSNAKHIVIKPYVMDVETMGWERETLDEYNSIVYEKIHTGLCVKKFRKRLVDTNDYFDRMEKLIKKGNAYVRLHKERIYDDLKSFYDIGMNIRIGQSLCITPNEFLYNPKFNQYSIFTIDYQYGQTKKDVFSLEYCNGNIKIVIMNISCCNRKPTDFNSNGVKVVSSIVDFFKSICIESKTLEK